MADIGDNYVLKVQGEDELVRLGREAEILRDKLTNSIANFGAGSASTRILADNLMGVEKRMAALNSTVGGTRNWALAFNAAAQGAEDLQYSVGGAMNNLGQVVSLLGAGGLVGVIRRRKHS